MFHSSRAACDRNLLFGILALQMDFISRDALIRAMHAWVLEKTKPLGQLLVEQGAMAEDARALLEPLVQKHLQMHSDDPAKSLASVGSVGSARQALEQIADSDVQASLAHVPAAASVAADLWPTIPPTLVGTPTSSGLRFHVLRKHAKGGLGEVFVAQDTELHREVALKEIQNQFADDLNSRSRFVLEAEITGGLEHPGIVPVYGLGTYADGRPYYAMRFIRGDSLQDAIARFHQADTPGRDSGERALSLRQLLGRFIGVCNAIAYAHSRGVLHRDLKPGNVMLGKYGETLVVDWGLAKPLSQPEGAAEATEGPLRPSSANGATPTQMGSVLGTPEYMSPEQAAGRLDQLGPASDVYSLGATLYCLLTGVAPFQRKDDLGAMLQQVQRGEFRPPRQIKREVPAALEAVCLKAMALRPDQRYATPRTLAADVERWLADEPVSAWREPVRLRVGRWARRHQTLMAAAATGVLVLVLAAGTGAWWLDRQRTEQRRGVESALAEVERLQKQARWIEARAVLEQARERLGQDGPRDLQQRLDQGERNLDLVAQLDAIRLKKASLIVGGFDTTGADREYEEAFRDLGNIEVNSSVDAAAARLRESAVCDTLLAALDDWAVCAKEHQRRSWLLSVARAADTDPWRMRVRDPAIWDDKAALMRLMTEGEISQQSPQMLVALDLRLRKSGGDAEPLLRTAWQRHPGDFWVNVELGNLLREKRPTDAVGYYRAALALRPDTSAVHNNIGIVLTHMVQRKEMVAEIRKAIEIDSKYAAVHYNVGFAGKDMGQLKEAVAAYLKAIELDPKNPAAHNNLGFALMEIGRIAEAAVQFRTAIEVDPKIAAFHNNLGLALNTMGQFKAAVSEHGKAIELDPKYSEAHNNLGLALNKMGQLKAAVTAYRKAIELDPKFATAHYNLGIALYDMGQFKEAVAAYRKAIELDPKFSKAHNNLGLALYNMGQLKEAVAEYRKAIELDPKFATAYYHLGLTLKNMGQLKEAVAACRKAIELDPKIAAFYNNLGLALYNMGQLKEAVAEYHKAIELDPKNALAHNNLGVALRDMGQLKEAVAAYHKAIELDPKYATAHYNLGNYLSNMTQLKEAVAAYRKAIELDPKYALAHNNLAVALYNMGQRKEGVAECHKAIELDPKNALAHNNLGDFLHDMGQFKKAVAEYHKAIELDPKFALAQNNLARSERMLALDKELTAFLEGSRLAANTAEQLSLAELCRIKKHYASTVRFYTDAFTAQPKLADDLRAAHRYDAACFAAKAVAGQGEDAAKLNAQERARLRQQARDWLRADLALWSKQIDKGTPQERAAAQTTLRHWQQDADLAGLRGKDAVDKLPEAERADCRKLWEDVAALLKKTEAKKE